MKTKTSHYLLLLLLLVLPFYHSHAAPTETAAQLLDSVKNKPLPERITILSGALLNKPYQFDPLGEGPSGKYSQEPLYRLDRFDCETFVNTVLALALAKDVADIPEKIKQINYIDGEVSFTHRDHFTDVDWVPSNTRHGYIKEITTQIAGPNNVATATVYNNRKSWYQHLSLKRIKIPNLTLQQKKAKLAELHAEAKNVTNSWGSITYIPLNAFVNGQVSYQNIPNASIILFIEHDPKQAKKIGTEISVSHMGFIIWRDGIPYLRHASSDHQKTIDIPLANYFNAHATNPKIKGVAFFMPSEQGGKS